MSDPSSPKKKKLLNYEMSNLNMMKRSFEQHMFKIKKEENQIHKDYLRSINKAIKEVEQELKELENER